QKYEYEPEVVIGTCHSAFALCAPGTGYGSIGHQDLLTLRQWVAMIGGVGTTAPSFQPATSNVVIASLSYVSGAHNFKAGFQDRFGYSKDIRFAVNGDLRQEYRLTGGVEVPSSVTVYNTPIDNVVNVTADMGLFAQDTWTTKR